MTDTIDVPRSDAGTQGRELSTLRLAELQSMAQNMGLRGTTRMRKSDLVAALRDAGATGGQGGPARPRAERAPREDAPSAAPQTPQDAPRQEPEARSEDRGSAGDEAPQRGRRSARRATAPTGHGEPDVTLPDLGIDLPAGGDEAPRRQQRDQRDAQDDRREPRENREDRREGRDGRRDRDERRDSRDDQRGHQDARTDSAGRAGDEPSSRRALRELEAVGEAAERRARERDHRDGDGNRNQNRDGNRNQNRQDRDDDRGGNSRETRSQRRRNRERNRDRKRRGRGQGFDLAYEETEVVNENDVLVPVAGILDVLENHAFLRTSGYLPGKNDVYVTLNQVRKNGLRKGDAVTGAVKAQNDDQQQFAQGNRQKYTPLVRLDTINGMTVEKARMRPEFTKLTPLYPNERLRLETTPKAITPRVIDLVSPVGKGQRGLIVSPPKAGKTIVMQQIANAIAVNNPECHLMVVLVDERPEEVTDMERTVKGEVIASTFDRPAADHTTVAELAIERAKRLVELGQDVVVLLDSLTRLSRAYNLAAPASGRILSGGVDASALYPPKRFFGAARNIENGGSLTILASALVETGSKMDEVIFEEFKGTGNMELRLSRNLADKRIFPAVDVNASGTRREEWLMDTEELKIIWRLRRVMGALDVQSAADLLLGKMRETTSNAEFLMTVQKTTPGMKDEPSATAS